MRLRYIFCKDIKGYSKQRYMLGLFMYKRRENEFMKKRMIRFCCGVMAAGLLLSGIPVPAMSGNMQKVAVSVLAEESLRVRYSRSGAAAFCAIWWSRART